MTMVIIGGGFDLSVGAIFAMGAVTSAWMALHVHPYFGLAMAPLVGLAMGTVNGLVITVLNVHSFLATIATSLIFKGIAIVLSNGKLIPVRMAEFTWLGRGKIGGVFIAVWVMVGLCAGDEFHADPHQSRPADLCHRRQPGGGHPVGHPRQPDARSSPLPSPGFPPALPRRSRPRGCRWGRRRRATGYRIGRDRRGDPGRHHDLWRRGRDLAQSVAGVFLLALINNGFNILNADPFYRDLTTGLIILAAIGVSASGKRS